MSDKRSEIIRAALEVFSTLGFTGASLTAIGTKAGTNKQLIAHHFKTKENLWQQVVDHELADGIELIERVRESQKLYGDDKALRLFISEYVLWVSSKSAVHRLMFLESQHKSTRLNWFHQRHVIPSSKVVIKLIKNCQAQGSVKQGNAGRMYFTILHLATSPLLGAHQYRAFVKKPPFSQSEILYHRETILEFLGLKQFSV